METTLKFHINCGETYNFVAKHFNCIVNQTDDIEKAKKLTFDLLDTLYYDGVILEKTMKDVKASITAMI